MGLLSLHVENFRCFKDAALELDAAFTLIHGANGSGKSSLLEAAFLLGRGRSFRASHLSTVIQRGADRLRVVGQVSAKPHQVFTLGIEARSRKTIARIAGEPASSLAALSTAFPVQIIEPGVHKLIEEGPVQRRRYMDWGVFHVEPPYLGHWQRFQRAVKQRNAALRAHASDAEIDSWDIEFSAAGEEIDRARQAYVHTLTPYLSQTIQALLDEPFELAYATGIPAGRSLTEALKEARSRDRARKTTSVGPHRADLLVRTEESAAKESVSRGQQKLLSAALVMGQLAYHAEYFGMRPTLLLDDPAAELDAEHLELLLERVRSLQAQVVVTSLRPDFKALGAPGRVFHVEHGAITPL